MPQRLAVAACLVILTLITSATATTSASADPAPSSPSALSLTAVAAKESRHRLFFANAQRESLTGSANARQRMRLMVRALRRSQADIGVLVELQGTQPRAFRERTHGAWGMIAPGHGVRNAVIYHRASWTPVSRRTIKTYWNGGRRTRTPVIVFRSTTGEQIGVIAVHNPRDNSRLRGINNRRILAAVRRLQHDGIGVLIAGDFNAGRAAVCLYTGPRHRMASASHHRRNACRNSRPSRIDQAFATRDVRLRGYRRSLSRATDHGAVYSIGFRPAPAPRTQA